MKFSSARGFARSRVPMIALLALAASIGIAGCTNDGNGPAGPDGGGDSGQTGPTGPTGPADVPISLGGDVRNVGTGSALTAQQIADIGTLVVAIDSAAIEGNKPALEITVKTAKGGAVLGLAATTLRLGVAKLVPAANGFPSRWQSYINRNATPNIATPALVSALQANTESGVAAGWQELGAGKYRYVSAVDLSTVTTPIAVAYDPALTHRISVAIDMAGSARALAPDNPFQDFVPNGGALTSSKRIAATANCETCHVRLAEHGGPRRSAEYCAVCHNPATIDPDSGESVDFAYMAHSIHRGEARTTPYVVYGFNGTRFDAGEVTYPQPISFCETCHVKTAAVPDGDDWNTNPGAAACGGCHDAGLNKTGPSATTGLYTYTYTHTSTILPPAYTADDGTCRGCHRADGAAGDILGAHKRDPDRKAIESGSLFTYKILQVDNAVAGQAPKVTFQILDAAGAPIDVKAIATGRLRLDFAWSTPDIHNVADVAGDLLAANRGQAITIDLIANTASIVDNGNGTFATRSRPCCRPASTRLHSVRGWWSCWRDGGSWLMDRRPIQTARSLSPAARRGKSWSTRPSAKPATRSWRCTAAAAHGDPMICTVCHNSSLGGTFDADTFGPLALGAFIHGLHAGNVAPIRCGDVPAEPGPLRGLPRCQAATLPVRLPCRSRWMRVRPSAAGQPRSPGRRPRRLRDGRRLQGLPHVGRGRDPHAIAGRQLRRCQGAGALVSRGRLCVVPRPGPDL